MFPSEKTNQIKFLLKFFFFLVKAWQSEKTINWIKPVKYEELSHLLFSRACFLYSHTCPSRLACPRCPSAQRSAWRQRCGHLSLWDDADGGDGWKSKMTWKKWRGGLCRKLLLKKSGFEVFQNWGEALHCLHLTMWSGTPTPSLPHHPCLREQTGYQGPEPWAPEEKAGTGDSARAPRPLCWP